MKNEEKLKELAKLLSFGCIEFIRGADDINILIVNAEEIIKQMKDNV